MEFYCEASDTRITLLPDDTYSINTMVAYDSPYLAMQFASYSEASTDFAKEIAPCRTFVFLREVEMLLANNLIKGGDLSNAIVIVDRKMDQPEIDRLLAGESHVTLSAARDTTGITIRKLAVGAATAPAWRANTV